MVESVGVMIRQKRRILEGINTNFADAWIISVMSTLVMTTISTGRIPIVSVATDTITRCPNVSYQTYFARFLAALEKVVCKPSATEEPRVMLNSIQIEKNHSASSFLKLWSIQKCFWFLCKYQISSQAIEGILVNYNLDAGNPSTSLQQEGTEWWNGLHVHVVNKKRIFNQFQWHQLLYKGINKGPF